MKFTPKDLGEAAENSSGKTTWADKFKDAVAVVVAVVFCISLLWLIADFGARFIPDSWESKIAYTPAESVRHKQMKVLNPIFNKFVSTPGLRKLDYQLFIMPMSQPNAFALPGGAIGVTDSLLDRIEGEKALALVLGHELGHHQHRHILSRLSRTVMTTLFFSLLGDSSAVSVARGGDTLAQLSFSRDQETEADEYAIRLVIEHYGNVDGAFEFFEMLVDDGLDKRGEWSAMLSTHPYTPGRIEHLKKYAQEILSQ